MTATYASARYYAARAEGRYRVIDGAVIDARQDGDAPGAAYVATCSSRAKAEAKAAQLNAEAQTAVLPTEDTVEQDLVDAAELEAALAPEAAAAEQSWADQQVEEAQAKAAKAKADALAADAVLAAVPAAAKPEADTKAYRIGRVLREWVLAHVTPADSALVEHITSRNVCYDGTATLRLTAEWAEELSGFATDLENALASGRADASGFQRQGRAVATMAARAARKGLANLF